MAYFEDIKKAVALNRILFWIIGFQMILLAVAFKMVINIAENKTIAIQVPQMMDPGKYIIGNNGASDDIYKMWGRIWFDQLTNFSYKNIDEKIKYILPFMDEQTLFKKKAELATLSKSIKDNFITQEFKVSEYEVKRLNQGYVQIEAKGQLFRKVGLRDDHLSGIPFKYKIIAFTRNGQVYIKSIDSSIIDISNKNTEDQLRDNPYVDFDYLIKEDEAAREKAYQEHRKKIKAKGGI